MTKFERHLDTVIAEKFGDEISAQTDLVNTARELLSSIGKMKQDMEQAELQLAHILEELNSALGREVRKLEPKMRIGLHNGTCSCGYHSRDLVCRPDIQKGTWIITGRLGNNLKRSFPETLRLGHDVTPLASAIMNSFKKYYRTLQK
jgi:hypothetical protein